MDLLKILTTAYSMSPDQDTKSGLYYADVAEAPLKSIGTDKSKMKALRDELWKISFDITKCDSFLEK